MNDTLLVPRFAVGTESPMFGMASRTFTYHDAALLAGYEREVTEALAKVGRKVVFIPADLAISQNGAIHCLTTQFPLR